MHRQMMCYADNERAREMELAAAESQVGCSCGSPFRTMFSRAIKGRNGREVASRKQMLDYAMAHPPVQTYYVRPNARTISVTTNSAPAHTTPPGPTRTYAAAAAPPPPRAGGAAGNKPRKKKKKKRVAFAPEAAGSNMYANAPPPHTGHVPPQHAGHAPHQTAVAASSSGAAASGVYYHQGGTEPYAFPAPPVHRQQGYAYGYGYGRSSAPSPLTRWDVVGTPRRHEYFSGEYRCYYPTPVRESIYSFATDANHRLTAIFSEENPNACAII